jgi:predicted Zn-dependent peptidase
LGDAPLQHRLTTLESGVRVVTEAMPSVRSVALGLWIGAGSRGEAEPEAGLSHFLEHLLFKGSERYASHEIDQIFDGMGAELNAGTGKETTSVYARFLDQHLERALDVMSDMVWRPAFKDVDSEREVVIEEIAMYEDDPQDHVFDILGGAVFGDHPLGRPIIGRREVIGATPVEAIAAFHAARYLPGNVVVAAAGSVDHDRLVELLSERIPAAAGSAPEPLPAPENPQPSVRIRVKDTEQYHVCLGAPGVARGDDRRFPLRILDAIFGGTSSSRLFQEIREKRGLAYAVSSFTGQYSDTGQIGLYLGTRPDNLAEALRVVAAELERIRSEPVSDAELVRAQEHAKGRLVLSLESTSSRMNRLGSSVLTDVPLLTVEESMERIEGVTAEQLLSLATEMLDPDRLSAAGVGPDEGIFRGALEPLGPRLAAAA